MKKLIINLFFSFTLINANISIEKKLPKLQANVLIHVYCNIKGKQILRKQISCFKSNDSVKIYDFQTNAFKSINKSSNQIVLDPDYNIDVNNIDSYLIERNPNTIITKWIRCRSGQCRKYDIEQIDSNIMLVVDTLRNQKQTYFIAKNPPFIHIIFDDNDNVELPQAIPLAARL